MILSCMLWPLGASEQETGENPIYAGRRGAMFGLQRPSLADHGVVVFAQAVLVLVVPLRRGQEDKQGSGQLRGRPPTRKATHAQAGLAPRRTYDSLNVGPLRSSFSVRGGMNA